MAFGARVLPVLASSLVIACQAPAEHVGAFGVPIVNGVVDTGHPAVGIVQSGTQAACTGTLIAPDQVLTAAHCVLTETRPYRYLQPVVFIVGGQWGERHVARAVTAHPDYAGGNVSDLALVWLRDPVSGVTPHGLGSSAPFVGEPITLVGYGVTAETGSEFGTKRKASNRVAFVDGQVFAFTANNGTASTVCSGDSGGPTFASRNGVEEVIGVHSTSEEGCNTAGFDMRVDRFFPWLSTEKASKLAYGETCLQGTDCLSGLCIKGRDGASYCTEACDNEACPSLDECVAVNATQISQACVPHTGVIKDLGASCSQHEECAGELCVVLSEKESVCTQRCDLQRKDCPTGYGCLPSQIGGLCIKQVLDPKPQPTKSGLGESCAVAGDCASNLCALTAAGWVCTELCDPKVGGCPSGFGCEGIAGSDKGACVKAVAPKQATGASCKQHDDCVGALCASFGGAMRCTEFCEPSTGCAGGLRCAPVGADRFVCDPRSNVAAGDAGPGAPGADAGSAATEASSSSSGCSLPARGPSPTSASWIVLLLASLALRRRRR